MGRKWTYCAVYSIIQIQFLKGVWEEIFNSGEDIYAPPNSDVNLTCQTKKNNFLVQMQWSKVTDKIDPIAVYHPHYGLYCFLGHACESQVTFIETAKNVTKWTLYLRNISTTFSGKYECSFTLYPEGIQTRVYNLIVAPYTQDGRSHTIETEANRTLKIPCFQNTSSETSPGFTFSWLVEKDGVQEVLFTHDDCISNSTSFKGRVKLGTDCGLHLSPVQIQDDGTTFSCHLRVSPVEVWKTSTTVKVFAKPEVLMIVENTTKDVLGKVLPTVFRIILTGGCSVLQGSLILNLCQKRMLINQNGLLGSKRVFICLLKNVFPKANITWLIDERFLQGDEEGIYITNDEEKVRNGFWELKSVLTRTHGDRPAQSKNMTIRCMALSPGPRNGMWSTSSQAIMLSLDSVNVPVEHLASGTGFILGTQPFPDDKVSPTRYPAMSSMTSADGDVSTPDATPQASRAGSSSDSGFWSPSSSPPEWLSLPGTSTGPPEPDAPVSLIPREMHTSAPSEASLAPHDVITSTTKDFPDVLTSANGMTENDHSHITSITVNKPRDGMSWPVVIAALLSFCTILFGLGVRKWCQYQKEIMERPPPFKPPPPPIKYRCIQEPTGHDLPCHEMEAL